MKTPSLGRMIFVETFFFKSVIFFVLFPNRSAAVQDPSCVIYYIKMLCQRYVYLYIFFFTLNYRSDRPGVQLYLNSTILINSLYDNACNFNK